MKAKKQTLQRPLNSGKKIGPEPPETEWNFDSERVPDCELVACCLWEYARESKTMCQLRKRCVRAWRDDPNGNWIDDYANGSLANIIRGTIKHREISVEAFLLGMILKSSFPARWQSLSPDERATVAKEDWKLNPYVPVEHGSLRDAQEIVRTVKEHKKFALENGNDKAVALARRIERLEIRRMLQQRGLKSDNEEIQRRVMLRYCVTDLARPVLVNTPPDWTGHPMTLPGGFVEPHGTTVSVLKIDWAHCDNKKIAEAIVQMRPTDIPEPKDRGGHKLGDWRAKLVSLGLLRLRGRYTVEDAIKFLSGHLPVEKRKKEKFSNPGQCNSEAKEAVRDFGELFPFLRPDEKPLCWPMKD